MNRRIWITLAAVAGVMSACSSEQFYRGIYEGSRQRQDALRAMDATADPQRAPDFDSYEAERRRLHPAPADATPEAPEGISR